MGVSRQERYLHIMNTAAILSNACYIFFFFLPKESSGLFVRKGLDIQEHVTLCGRFLLKLAIAIQDVRIFFRAECSY